MFLESVISSTRYGLLGFRIGTTWTVNLSSRLMGPGRCSSPELILSGCCVSDIVSNYICAARDESRDKTQAKQLIIGTASNPDSRIG